MTIPKYNAEGRLAQQRAILIIIIMAASAGGHLYQAKIKYLGLICARSPIFAGNSRQETNTGITFATGIIAQLGWNAIEQAAAILSPALRETAFALAQELILSDGDINDNNERFIFRLLETLQIKEEVAIAILRVSIIRAMKQACLFHIWLPACTLG